MYQDYSPLSLCLPLQAVKKEYQHPAIYVLSESYLLTYRTVLELTSQSSQVYTLDNWHTLRHMQCRSLLILHCFLHRGVHGTLRRHITQRIQCSKSFFQMLTTNQVTSVFQGNLIIWSHSTPQEEANT